MAFYRGQRLNMSLETLPRLALAHIQPQEALSMWNSSYINVYSCRSKTGMGKSKGDVLR